MPSGSARHCAAAIRAGSEQPVPNAAGKIWNVAVVGCGIGRAHIEGYRRHPDKFRVLALCDIDDGRLAAVADEFSIGRRTRSLDDALRMDDIEIIDICTPPALHVVQTVAALVAGKEVLCEKPVAGALANIDRMIAAEDQAFGRVMPIFQYRFGNGVQKAKRLVDLGIAGTPYLATVETAWSRTSEYYKTPWRGQLNTELGGVLLSHAIHSHDLLTYLMGLPQSVFARTATRVNPVEVEDCAVASLVMQSGALVSLAATLGSYKEISRLRLCFEHVTLESSQKPYAPGDEPWQIIPASPEAAARIGDALAGHRFVPSRFAGADGGVSRSADNWRRLAGDPGGRPPVTGAGHRPLSFGRDR
jgi:predicted dehydrogenase